MAVISAFQRSMSATVVMLTTDSIRVTLDCGGGKSLQVFLFFPRDRPLSSDRRYSQNPRPIKKKERMSRRMSIVSMCASGTAYLYVSGV